jgi:hypothetical protein
MSFSNRVGLEPAADLKKRICSLCEEAEFIVVEARMSMHRQETMRESVRLIEVYAHDHDWNPTVPDSLAGSAWDELKNHQVAIMAMIGCDGSFDGTVEVRCSATDQAGKAFCPTLRNCRFPISELPQWLPEIVRQMRSVIEARKRGEKGPWRFGDQEVWWENWK